MALPYGMDDAKMISIINATDEALGKINTLNSTVQLQAGDLYRANTSDSGRILSDKFNAWSGDFAQIQNSLVQLNQKAKALRQANLNASGEASGAAQGAQV